MATGVWGASDASIGAAEYRARAGALTLSYLSSGLTRDMLRAVLAQAATDIDLVDVDELPEPDEEQRVRETFADRYLLEPVNPGDDQDDPETMMQPTPAGREVPLVGATLQGWLRRCPAGPIELGEDSADALWALLAGWTSTVVHALAAGRRTVSEVQADVGVLDEEAVAVRLSMLEDVGLLRHLVEPGGAEEAPFEPSEWLRFAIAPLAAAARMELRHPLEDTAPIAAADVEAALRLTLPLLRMPADRSGACSLEIELDEGVLGGPVGMTARIERGSVVACDPGIDSEADAWVAGPTAGWLDAVIDRNQKALRSGGDRRLPRDLLGALHNTLFGGR